MFPRVRPRSMSSTAFASSFLDTCRPAAEIALLFGSTPLFLVPFPAAGLSARFFAGAFRTVCWDLTILFFATRTGFFADFCLERLTRWTAVRIVRFAVAFVPPPALFTAPFRAVFLAALRGRFFFFDSAIVMVRIPLQYTEKTRIIHPSTRRRAHSNVSEALHIPQDTCLLPAHLRSSPPRGAWRVPRGA